MHPQSSAYKLLMHSYQLLLQRMRASCCAAGGDLVVGRNGRLLVERLQPRLMLSVSPSGAETLVNSGATNGNQQLPAVAMDLAGASVVVWQTDQAGGQIEGQLFSASGAAVGSSFQISQTNAGAHPDPSVAMSSSGSFVVCWEPGGSAVDFRVYDSTGTPVTGQTLATSSLAGSTAPSIAMAGDGSFMVVFEGDESADNDGIYGQRFTSAGAASGSAFLINTTTQGQQTNPSVAADAAGDYAVAWTDESSGTKVKAAYLPASGSSSGEMAVGTTGSDIEDNARASLDGSGDFVVTWDESGSNNGIYARRYNSSAVALDAAPVLVSSPNTNTQTAPDIAVRADGSYVIAWTAGGSQDGSSNGVYAQSFTASGGIDTSQFLVNTTTQGSQQDAAVAYEGGNAVVAWDGKGSGDPNGVFLQRYTASQATDQAPVNTVPATQSITENNPLTFSSATGNAISLADTDAYGGTEQLTLTVSSGTLSITYPSGVTFVSGGASGGSSMSFTGSIANLNAALDGLVFTPAHNSLTTATLQLITDDLGNTGTGGPQSTTSSITIHVSAPANPANNIIPAAQTTPSNIPLVFMPINGNAINFGSSWNAIQLSVSHGTLTLASTSGLSFGTGNGTANATVSFSGTQSAFNAAVNGLTYTATNGYTGSDTLKIITTNSGLLGLGLLGSSTTTNVSLTVTAAVVRNQAPTVSVPVAQTTVQNTSVVFSTARGNAVSISDGDANGGTEQVTLVATSGNLSLSTTTGLTFSTGTGTAASSMTFTGTLAGINAALNGLSFSTASNFVGSGAIDVLVDDLGNSGAGGAMTGSASVAIAIDNATPTVATAAAASPSPVTGTTATLTVLGADDEAETDLTYTWATTGTPPAPVTFSDNADNSAQSTVATFSAAGTYQFQVTITDVQGASATSTVAVAVSHTLSEIIVLPSFASVAQGTTQQCTAVAYDQFGNALATQPTFTWALSGGGSISQSGLVTAPASTGAVVVKATSGSYNGIALLNIVASPSDVGPPGAETAKSASLSVSGSSPDVYTWSVVTKPAGAPEPTFSPNANTSASASVCTFYQAGSYLIVCNYGNADGSGARYCDSFEITVEQVTTSVSVTPATAVLSENGTQQFAASATDEFGDAMSPEPAFTWTIQMGAGSVSSSGLYTAPGSGGTSTVQAASGSVNASATVVINAPPTVATPAAASPDPVTGTTTSLSVLGADDGGESNLKYTWVTTGTPPAAVTYSDNGDNSAKNTTATFTAAGTYDFQVTITDSNGLSTTSSVSVTVSQSLREIIVLPSLVSVPQGTTQQCTAVGYDQFGTALAAQPTFTWAISGGGTISQSGLFTAPGTSGGSPTITASSGSCIGLTSLLVVASPANVVPPYVVTRTHTAVWVHGYSAAYTYTWSVVTVPSGASNPTFSINASTSAHDTVATFYEAGTYLVVCNFGNGNGSGTRYTATVSLTVEQTPTTVNVLPTSSALHEQGTQQFTASANDQFGMPVSPAPTFTWAISSGTGSINSSGLYTAAISPGTATVTATAGSATGSASVTVTNATPTVATAAAASPNPVTGTTAALSVLGADDGGESNLTYTWAVVSGPNAPVTVLDNGNNSAKNAIATFAAAGTYDLQVTITDLQGASVTSAVTVTVTQTLREIVVLPSITSVAEGTTQQCAAVGYDQFGHMLSTQPTFAWSVSGGGTINQSGLYTAPAAAGDYPIIKATSGSCIGLAQLITVATPADVVPPGYDTGSNASVNVAGYSTSYIYTWSLVSQPAGAPAPTFSANATTAAYQTVITFYQAGTYVFVCNFGNADGSGTRYCGSFEATVEQKTTSIALTPSSVALNENGTQQFSASGTDQFGNPMSPQPTFTWAVESGNGTIGSNGLYTAGGAPGNATIQASSGSVNASAAVTVTNAPPTVATPAAASPDPVTGTMAALSVLGADDGGESNLTYTWATTGTPPAPVSFTANNTNAAKNTTAIFTKSGAYTLRVTITDSGGLTTTGSVSVQVNQALTSIVVLPATAALNENGQQQFVAAAFDQFGNLMATQPTFTWSLPSGTGMVTQSGLYTALGSPGSATVRATSGSVSGNASVSVTNAPPTVAVAAAASPTPVAGTTTSLSVLGADDGGESNLTYTWATTGTPPAPVSFNVNGSNAAKNTTATFTRSGKYYFRVTITDAGGLSTISSVNVTVNQDLTSIAVASGPGAMADNTTYPFSATALDQFGNALASQPIFTWSVDAGGPGGTINSAGLYSTPASGTGTDTIRAVSGSTSGTTTVNVTGDGIFNGGSDVGSPTLPGSFSYNAGTYTVTGGYGTSSGDKFQYAYSSLTGNHALVAKVTNTNGTSTPALAGVMFRDTTGSTSPYAAVLLAPEGTVGFYYRSAASSAFQTITVSNVAAPQWVEVVRNGNTFSGYYSADGARWTQIGSSITFANPDTLLGGLMVASFDSAALSTATFTNVGFAVPTIATAAAASPGAVTGTSTQLSVLGAYSGGESNLTYTWSTTGTPPASVNFADNGDNSAKSTTAAFTKAGTYDLLVTVSNGSQSVTSGVAVTVSQTLTAITVTPGTASLNENGTRQFSATGYDQFGAALATQPAFTWSNSGVGSVSTSGLYTAPGSGSSGIASVTAASGSISGIASVSVSNAAPTVAVPAAASTSPVTGNTTSFSVLGADDGGEPNLIYAWATTGTPPAAVSFSDNDSNSAKNTTATFTKAGTYDFRVTITDAGGLTVTSSVGVDVTQTLTSVVVIPGSASVSQGETTQFAAIGYDQFGAALQAQPVFNWSVVRGYGSVAGSGLYTAPAYPTSPLVIATSGGVSGSASVSVSGSVQTLVVDTTADLVDGNTTSDSTLLSSPGADGKISLREAITAADNTPGLTEIAFDLPGGGTQTIAPTSSLPAITEPVIIDGTTQPGYSGAPLVQISGAAAGLSFYGLDLAGGDSTVRGLAIDQFSIGTGILVQGAGNDQIAGNEIGVDPAGTAAAGNNFGITILGVGGNIIGGTTFAGRNVISGNASAGVYITNAGASDNLVEGNYVGLNAAGTAAIPNSDGIYFASGATNNTIGGTDGGSGNIISGNQTGVFINGATTSGNGIQGNHVGTSAAGTAAVPNQNGIVIFSPDNLVGGIAAGAGNVIAGNSNDGILIEGAAATGNLIEANNVGTTAEGTAAVPNVNGIEVDGADNLIGGTAVGAGNVISGNSNDGVLLSGGAATGDLVEGNDIGTNADGAAAVGNLNGVFVGSGASDNTIGGTGASEGNVIADNSNGSGVSVSNGAVANAIRGNAIYGNQPLGIDLGGAGIVNPNTGSETASLANEGMNAPVITSAAWNGPGLTISGYVGSAPNQTAFAGALVDVYLADNSAVGQGETYLGTLTADADGNFNGSLVSSLVSPGDVLTATATDTSNNTSEFAADFQIVNGTSILASPAPVTGTSTALSVGGVNSAQSNLTFDWATTGAPPAPVSFSANGTSNAQNTTATFTKAGTYTFQVTITVPGGATVTDSTTVTVSQTCSSIAVAPTNAALHENATEQFSAIADDQFGDVIDQPGLSWSVAGVGSVGASGLYTAPGPGGSGTATVTAGSGSVTGSASVSVTNAAPTVAAPATASPGPVTGTTTSLSVLGADDGGESDLTYTWSTVGPTPAPVHFSDNADNSAKSTTATFTAAGTYSFQVEISDVEGLSALSTVGVTVDQSLTAIAVNPSSPSVAIGQTQALAATALDQFGSAMAAQPAVAWSVGGGGAIDGSGSFTAPAAAGTYSVTATSGPVSGTAQVTVANATSISASPEPVDGTSCSLSVAGAAGAGLTYTWSVVSGPATASAPTFSNNGSVGARSTVATFSSAGSYVIEAQISDGHTSSIDTAGLVVVQTLTSVSVDPSPVTLDPNDQQTFTATGSDQFGQPLSPQPAFTWTVSSGPGSIDPAGLYTAPSSAGSATIIATSASIAGNAQVTIAYGVAHTPSVTDASTNEDAQTTSGLVISPNGLDDPASTWFLISNISGGSLFQNDGATPINDGDFIPAAWGLAGLRFTPSAGSSGAGGFDIEASTTPNAQGIGGAIIGATIAVRPRPVVAVNGGLLAYTERQGPAAIAPQLTVVDLAGNFLVGATVHLDGYAAGQDVLTFPGAGGITSQWDSSDGTLELSGSASVANYQAALRLVSYSNTSEDPDTSLRSASFTTTDGTLSSTPVSQSITVTAVNDPPVVGAPGPRIATAGTPLQFSSANGTQINVSDPDANGAAERVALTASEGALTLPRSTGLTFLSGDATSGDASITFTGTLSDINVDLDGLTFTPLAGYLGPASLEVLANDLGNSGTGGPMTASRTIAIAVEAPPGITVNPTTGLETTDAGGTASFTIALTRPPTSGVSIGLQSSNAAAGMAAVDSVTFTPADWDVAQNVTISGFNDTADPGSRVDYQIRLLPARSADPLYASLEGPEVNVTDIKEPPTVQTSAGAAQYLAGSAPAVVDGALTLAGPDAEVTGATVTLKSGYVSGQDSLVFSSTGTITGSWDKAAGKLALSGTASVADYQAALRSVAYVNFSQAAKSGARTIEFSVTNDGGTASATRSLQVTAVNAPPAIVAPASGQTPSDTPLVFSNATATPVAIVDPDAGASVILVSLTARKGSITLPTMQGLTFTLGGSSGSLSVQFSGTLQDVNAALDGLQFTPFRGYAGPASLLVNVNDLGNSGDGVARSSSTVVPIAIQGPIVTPRPPLPPSPAATPIFNTPATGPMLLSTLTTISGSSVAAYGGSSPSGASTMMPETESAPVTDAGSTGSGGAAPNPGAPARPAAGPDSASKLQPPPAAAQRTNPGKDLVPPAPAQPGIAGSRRPTAIGGNSDNTVPAGVTTSTVAVPADVQAVLGNSSPMWEKLDQIHESLVEENRARIVAGTASFMSVGASFLYLAWLLRAGSLASSVLSSMPAWSFVDPLPILDQMDGPVGDEDDEESLQSMVGEK